LWTKILENETDIRFGSEEIKVDSKKREVESRVTPPIVILIRSMIWTQPSASCAPIHLPNDVKCDRG
jgi:hypothetical protein